MIINKINKKFYTRQGATRKSLLDHISTNLKKRVLSCDNSSLSDHKQIYVEMKKMKPPPKIHCSYESINYKKLTESIKKSIIQEKNEYDVTGLENLIKTNLDQSKVTKTKIINEPQKEWIN
jgi:uncharacterized Zn-finger protein